MDWKLLAAKLQQIQRAHGSYLDSTPTCCCSLTPFQSANGKSYTREKWQKRWWEGWKWLKGVKDYFGWWMSKSGGEISESEKPESCRSKDKRVSDDDKGVFDRRGQETHTCYENRCTCESECRSCIELMPQSQFSPGAEALKTQTGDSEARRQTQREPDAHVTGLRHEAASINTNMKLHIAQHTDAVWPSVIHLTFVLYSIHRWKHTHLVTIV